MCDLEIELKDISKRSATLFWRHGALRCWHLNVPVVIDDECANTLAACANTLAA